MNIVGHFAETVFVTVKELYRNLNPATLTGGIDVIVVRQPDGSFQCSPFHVRFGKLGVLRSKEKVVDIEINGEPVDLHMKLGDNGEAFFVEENENQEVPLHLCTSPILLDSREDVDDGSDGTLPNMSRRKKRRRRRMRSESLMKEENNSSSEDKEKNCEVQPERSKSEGQPTTFQVSQSVYYSMSEEPEEDLSLSGKTRSLSDGERSTSEGTVFYSRQTSPKSESEINEDSPEPQIQWNWGGFPTVCPPETTPPASATIPHSGSSHFRVIERQKSFDAGLDDSAINCGSAGSVTVVKPQPRTQPLDLDNSGTQTIQSSPERNSHAAFARSSNLFVTCSSFENVDPSKGLEGSFEKENKAPSLNSDSDGITDKPTDDEQLSNETEEERLKRKIADFTTLENDLEKREDKRLVNQVAFADELSSFYEEERILDSFPKEEEVIDGSASSQGEKNPKKAEEKNDGLSPAVADESPKSSNVELQDKKKGKRNQHLGPSDIYLDDLTTLNPEVAALYFPKSESDGASQQGAEQVLSSGSQSPQSVSSAAADSGTEYLSDSNPYILDVSMSLCGQEGDTRQITKETFAKHLVTYQDFVNNPGIIEDPSLVICINSNYYNWAVAAPIILSMTAFQKNLPESTIDQLVKDKMSKKSGRWWFSWRRKDMANNQQKQSRAELKEQLAKVSASAIATLDDIDNDEAAGLGRIASLPPPKDNVDVLKSANQMFRKSLRLTSKQIEGLNLRDGPNKVVFSVTTQYQGTCRCEATIYLWNWHDRVIISDIDGTITRSDALGHILPQFGKDWTQKGIAKLYDKIHQNGYKFLYCSARAIGMAGVTKNYLEWVNDQGIILPKGPLLLAPSSLFSALHREVIEKKPELFKITCLTDIRDLFYPSQQPFYAAFGNKSNDVQAYKQVGVSESRIFTVNPKGELVREQAKFNKSSYSHLSELVEHFFPLVPAEHSSPCCFDCPEFSSFSYWKEPLPEVNLDEIS